MNLICNKCGHSFKKKGFAQHFYNCNLTLELIKDIELKYKSGLSIHNLMKEYNLSKSKIYGILNRKKLIRTSSEAAKLAHKKYPDKFKHSDISKKKMRISRLNYMKKHPENTAWRKKNISYPEKIFFEKIKSINEFIIIREKSFFPYFADFTIENANVVIEIDGSQHELEERKKSDKLKDILIISNGYRVIRFRAIEVLENIDLVFRKLSKFISSGEIIKKSTYISLTEKKLLEKEKKEKEKNRLKEIKQILRIKDFNDLKNEKKMVVKLQKRWGISHTSVRRWILKNTGVGKLE